MIYLVCVVLSGSFSFENSKIKHVDDLPDRMLRLMTRVSNEHNAGVCRVVTPAMYK